MRWFIVVLLVSVVVSSCGGGGGGDVWDVVEAQDFDGGVNEPGVLSALDQELAAIDNREGLDDSIETVGDLFTEGLIDVGKRDELLDRLDRVESRLADDSDEDDHEQSELQVGDDECEASDQADEARATDDVRVWDVIDADREGGLCVNDPAVLAAFDAQIAVIGEPGDLADVRDDVVTVFADGYIDAPKRDELLDRLSEVESGLRGEPDTADPGEEVILETETTEPPPEPRSLADGIVEVEGLLQQPADHHDRDLVPRADLIGITVGDDGTTVVAGAPGAVPFGRITTVLHYPGVAVVNVEWGTLACVDRLADGSFEAQIEAPPGSTLLVQPSFGGDCRTVDHAPAAVLVVPGGTSTTHGLLGGNPDVRWSAEGEVVGPDRGIRLSFPNVPPSDCVIPRVEFFRLFDGEGEYLTQVNLNVHGPALTPTGLPIQSNRGIDGWYDQVRFGDSPACLEGDIELTPDEPEGLPPGWYVPRIGFGWIWGNDPIDWNSGCADFAEAPLRFECNVGSGYLPMFSVGDPPTPRLPASILNEAVSWGANGMLGVGALEDEGRFALGNRRTGQGTFIASPRDPLSGRVLHYALDTFLPTVGYTSFSDVLPQPMFGLDQSAPGELSVTLTTPDGESSVLADSLTVQMFAAASNQGAYPAENSFSGPSHTIGLTTFEPALDLFFDQYGRHEVRLEGSIRSSRGDEFRIDGTYEFWVAEPLDLSLGTFEGTPLEVGDRLSATVLVEPGVPASVTVDVAHFIDGDREREVRHTVTGNANDFGWFATEDAWVPEVHGEYRVDVLASWVDPVDGTLWMGSRSAASIVATPDTPFVAHGARNADFLDLEGGEMPRTWYFLQAVDPDCPPEEGTCDGGGGFYPFFSGDVMWLSDGGPLAPVVTVDGPQEAFDAVAPHIGFWNYCRELCIQLEDQRNLVSAFVDGTPGEGEHNRPDDVATWAYWYSSSVRADVQVFQGVSIHNPEHNHWYGTDTYNCQIGLPCHMAFHEVDPLSDDPDGSVLTERNGDEEGDIKLLFGGAVMRTADEQHFIPYASFAVLIPKGRFIDGVLVVGDEKGDRVCPPYQGAAGGLGTCGPILTHSGREVDLFITPTGTRPGNVLTPGDLFTFSGQAWPTLDVGVEVTVTTPSGTVHAFANRANTVGYVDDEGMTFVVEEPGVYEVHVAATQDRPIPSTGLAPDPAIVADGRTVQEEYGYVHPLSAVLGSEDSTYRFAVVERRAEGLVAVRVDDRTVEGWFADLGGMTRIVDGIGFSYVLPDGAVEAHVSLTAPGLVLIDEVVLAIDGAIEVSIVQQELNDAGFTQIILGADTLQLSIAYETADGWEAQILNQRGFSPLGG